jgi:putative ABC transport system ATP-binding protein
VGLQNRAAHRPAELSGGQQQRVAIARVLAAQPPLILADEPTGNLDGATSREILSILQQLHGEGQTIVMITHDDGIAAAAHRQMRMEQGRLS